MTTMSGAAPVDQDRKTPGRPRSARVDEAIIEAALNLLAEGTPVETLSIESIAARAGVGKAAIYRRWSNKDALILDAVATVKGELPPITGESVRADLLALLRPMATNTTRAGRIMPCLMSEMRRNPQLHHFWQQVLEPRREAMRQVLRGGIARGELRDGLDLDVLCGMLTGPMTARNLVNWNPHLDTPDLPERLVDTMLALISVPTPD